MRVDTTSGLLTENLAKGGQAEIFHSVGGQGCTMLY